MKPTDRHLIVNSDDFGLSEGINRGIIRAHTEGILTSTSLMVRQPAAPQAASLAKACPSLSIGLHLDLAEWVFRNAEWCLKYQVIPTDDARAVTAEIASQIQSFRRLLGRSPTHLDSHQHLHRNEPVRAAALAAAQKLGVPLRECSDTVHFCGDFYGQTGEGEPYPEGISLENLLRIFTELKPGWTEVSCHVGDDDSLDSVYRDERKIELDVLCNPQVRAAIASQNIQLRSFADVAAQTEKSDRT